MSVAALPTETAVRPVSPRADRKSGGDDTTTDFKSMVRDEPAKGASKAEDKSPDKNADEASTERKSWRPMELLFGRGASKTAQEDGEASDETSSENQGEEDGDAIAAAITTTSGKDKEKASGAGSEQKLPDQAVQTKATALDNTPEGEAEEAAAKSAQRGEAAAAAKAEQNSAADPGKQTAAERQPTQTQPVRAQSSDQPQTARPQPAAAADAAAQQPQADGDAGNGDRESGERNGDRKSAQAMPGNGNGRSQPVTVISQQVTPAMPAQPAVGSTTVNGLVDSLAEAVSKSHRSDMAAQVSPVFGGSKPGPVTTLKIQLQPIELGTVTARISGTDAQLSIEITVDNAEARHKLSADSDSVVTSLRGMGIEVDRITIQQSQSNTGTMQGNGGRGSEFAQADGGKGERQDQPSRQGFGREQGGDAHGGQGNARPDASGSGVYI